MHDLVIIGGGAASQAAAMYALGKQIDFLLVCDRFGGRVEALSHADQDYLLSDLLDQCADPAVAAEERQLIGSSAVHLFERQLSRQPERRLNDRATRVQRMGQHFIVEMERTQPIMTGTVIVATGAAPRHFNNVPGEHLVACLGYSNTHHVAALAGKAVAVIGDSEQAVYSAAEFAHEAYQVFLVLPDAAAAERRDVALLHRQRNVAVLPGFTLVEVRGVTTARQLVLTRNHERLTLEVDGAFADLGREPASALVGHLVKMGTGGFIQVDRGFATSVPGLFAAGDVTRPEGEHVLAAIGDGARAARSAHFFLLTRPMARAVGQGR